MSSFNVLSNSSTIPKVEYRPDSHMVAVELDTLRVYLTPDEGLGLMGALHAALKSAHETKLQRETAKKAEADAALEALRDKLWGE